MTYFLPRCWLDKARLSHSIVIKLFLDKSLGDNASAQKDLDHVLSLECKDPVDHYGRGLALILSNRIPESFAEFESAFTDSFLLKKSSVDNILDPVREMPEFKALFTKFQ